MPNIEGHIEQVLMWADDKGITRNGTPIGQAIKTMEEAVELAAAINRDDYVEIRDAIGDIMVTLIIQADMQGLTLNECLAWAYAAISNRKGQMVNGVFVKDE